MFTFEDYDIDFLNIIDGFPINFYMKDKSGKFIWCNKNQLQNLGLKGIDEFINKTEYDFRDKSTADMIKKNDDEV